MKAPLGILPELTKAYILDRVTQEEIAEFYTGVPVNETTLQGNSFTSPMRLDSNPTCNYYYINGRFDGQTRLKLRDWDGTFHGDVFDIASYYTKVSSKTSQGFKLLLHKVASDFKIHKYSSSEERKKLETVVEEYEKRTNLKVFKVIPRAWNVYDGRYWWDRYGISSDLLRLGRVIPVQQLEVEGKDGYFSTAYKYWSKDPAFAYYGGEIEGIKIWKIYFPLRKKGVRRFLSNYAFIYKLRNELPSRIGIITKSVKDVLAYKSFNLVARAVPSETYVMTKDEFFDFKSKHDVVFTNFDYDRAGIVLANKYKKIHNCFPLMFTKGRYNQPDFGIKDFSDFREAYGREKTKTLIQTIADQHQDLFTDINKHNYNTLSWIQ